VSPLSLHLLTAAIVLKTRSPVLSTTAFIPLVGPAYLAYTLRKDHKPENTFDRLGLAPEVEEYPSQLLPFKHGLLNYDWAPVLHIGKFDKEMYITGRKKFSGIYDLIRKGDEEEKLRKAEAKAKKRKAREEEKAKRRKAREEENEMARDKNRGPKMERRDQRNKMKYDRQKRAEEEEDDPDRPEGRRQPERRKRPERRRR
jgi:hypothetical protein